MAIVRSEIQINTLYNPRTDEELEVVKKAPETHQSVCTRSTYCLLDPDASL